MMFNNLVVDSQSSNDLDVESFEDLYLENLENVQDFTQVKLEIKELLSTMSDLQQLSDSIQTNGLTKSLMSFANKNNILSKHIPSIPSLESLTADLSPENSKAALEGISDTIKTIYKKTLGKVIALLGNFKTSFKIKIRSLPAIRLRVDNYLREISGKEFDEEKAHKIVGKFSKYEDLLKLLDFAIQADKIQLELFNMELPTSEDAFVKFKEYLKKFKETHGNNYRFPGSDFHYFVHSAASLKDNGYTGESFHVIASKIDEFVRATLSGEAALASAENNYYEKVEKLLEDMSATYTAGNGGSATAYTKIGHMLIEVTNEILEMAFDIYNYSYRDGPVKALKTLGSLRKAYK